MTLPLLAINADSSSNKIYQVNSHVHKNVDIAED